MDSSMPLDDRLKLARAALAAAKANARDTSKNPTYWNTQVDQEKLLVERLEAELRESLEPSEPDKANESAS